MGSLPSRFTIRPDDYHVPYAGTAADGRRFFLSDELFSEGTAYVGLFLWGSDGTFDEVRVTPAARPGGLPSGQAGPAPGAAEAVQAFLDELGGHVLEPISVAPFLATVDGVEFGWRGHDEDGYVAITIEPGDFICYYEPWDGYEYDT